jgi:hypothetical protein
MLVLLMHWLLSRSLRVCNTFDSVVACFDEELNVTLGESGNTLPHDQSCSVQQCQVPTNLESTEWRGCTWSPGLLIVARLRLLVFFGTHCDRVVTLRMRKR